MSDGMGNIGPIFVETRMLFIVGLSYQERPNIYNLLVATEVNVGQSCKDLKCSKLNCAMHMKFAHYADAIRKGFCFYCASADADFKGQKLITEIL